MKSIFEILKERNIDHNILLSDVLDHYFHFLASFDPSILNQMTAEEICDHHQFFNNDSYIPVKFLFENNKISLSGFKNVMLSDYYYINETDEKMNHMYQLLENFIKDNKVDITEYFRKNTIYKQLELILCYKSKIDQDVYINNLNLERALENSDSIAVLLFGFKHNDLPRRREIMLEYICENFDLISDKFFFEKSCYMANPSYYYDSDDFEQYPIFIVASYIHKKYGLLHEKFKNRSLVYQYALGLLRANDIEKLEKFLNEIKEEFKSIYTEIKDTQIYKNHFLISDTLKLEGLTVEKLHNFLDNCDDVQRRIVTKDLNYYIEVNKNEFNYDYRKGKFYSEYTKEFLEYQLDESIRLFNLKKEFAQQGKVDPITSHWRWNGFTTDILHDIIHLCVEKDNWHDLIEKSLGCEMYQEYFTTYVQSNGDLKLLNYINEYQPQLIYKMNHNELINKIIVSEYNKEYLGG